MRCRSHLYDMSSSVGVCATCLRERLSALIDEEADLRSYEFAVDRLKPQHWHPPPPLLFPRSVSPYTFKHDLEDAAAKHPWMLPDRRFFSTPQFEIRSARKTGKETKISGSKFSIIAKLFRSKSQKFNSEKTKIDDQPTASAPKPVAVSSPGWFPSLRRKSKLKQSTPDQTPLPARRIEISPNRSSCDTPISHPWRKPQTPSNTAPGRRSKSNTSLSGMIIGMSPLVRPSPSRLWSQRSYASDAAFGSLSAVSGELRVPAMSTSASLRGKRSRKLADIGRFNPSR
uniref:Uncharacterized protein n=1 Tax=Kalanchoe fedtschenkoi TaxID=63787 RepID=A0A7N1A7L3_KALFE